MDFGERTKLLIDDEKLASGTVLVFGLGGVGSFVAESLVRMGLGHIIICDNDTVNVSNINRQLIALHSTVGRKKIDAAKERYLDINPELDICTYDTFILPENAGEFFDSVGRIDYVADCIDTVSGKLAITEECSRRGIPVISCMGTGNKLHPEMFRIDDIYNTSVCPLCRVMRRELRARGIPALKVLYSTEEPQKWVKRPGLLTQSGSTDQVFRPKVGQETRSSDPKWVDRPGLPTQNGSKAYGAAGSRVIGSIATVPSVAGLMIANHIAMEMAAH